MSEHSIGEAQANLSDLIDRALAGEGVVITREGRPAVVLKPLRSSGRPVTDADLRWLAERRAASSAKPCAVGAGATVSRLRDEGW